MSSRTRPVLSVFFLCLSLTLCLPLQAQVAPGPGDGSWSSLLSALWERLSAPLVSLWGMDPDGVANKNDETEGVGPGGNVEPDSGTTEGRGAWDPNG